ncbi:MAG TPA: hypothetical protein VNJ06_13500 [Gemmatimonadales bacterium]|nr:hypothetical protein [Gemmatimonadales bacterium]
MTISLLAFVLIVAQGPVPESFVPGAVTLDVRIDYATPRLSGSIAYTLENWTTHPARTLSFLVHRLMDVARVQDGTGRPLQFAQDVVRFRDDPVRQVTQVVVTLRRPVPPGATTTVRLEYGGYLAGYTEVGWLYVKDHIDTAFTIIREDALAFPVIGGISDAANRKRPRPDFLYDASVTVPSRYVVAMGGAGTRTAHADGTVTWRYVSGAPSPFLNVAIAPFDTIASEGVRIYYFHEDSTGARRLMANAQLGLHTLGQWLGPRRGLSLAITEIPDGWGSQASAVGGIIQTASAFRDSMQVGELYHELSHLWNTRDLDNPSPRWNEGLATFFETLMRERLNGWTGRPEYYHRRIANLRTAVAADSTLRRVPFIDYGAVGMTGASYRVGDLMFATLYELIGSDRFNQIIGGYFRRFGDGGTTHDFVGFATQQDPGLSRFFSDWLFSTRWTERLSDDSVAAIAARYRATPP